MKIRLVCFNVENLFVLLDRPAAPDVRRLTEAQWQSQSRSTIANKPLAEILSLSRAVEELAPDILMLCEVGGLESLENFNRHFLAERYKPFLIEGNSERGIDIGYLVNKQLPFKYDLRSHRQRPLLAPPSGLGPPEERRPPWRFSRDVLELRIFSESDEQRPLMVVLLVHLKSQWDREGNDPGGRSRRWAEVNTVLAIYREISEEFQEQVPIVLAGDFNGKAGAIGTDAEFASIYTETDLRDCLEVAGRPSLDRATFFRSPLIPHGGAGGPVQLDYIFLPQSLHAGLASTETFVYRFAEGGRELATRGAPSDHFPVVATLLI